MVYSFRKRKLKRAWGNSNANDNSGNNNGNSNGNVQYNFNDLESAARLSSRFLGRPAPDLNDLATQFLKQSEVESDVEEGEDVEDVDNNIDNILRTTEADDDNNSSGHKILSNIHDSQYQQKVTEDDEFEGTDLKKAKVFFSKLKDFYKENYDRVVLVFIDSLQRFQKQQIDQLALTSILHSLLKDSNLMEDFFLLVFQSSSEAVRGNTSTGGLNGGLDENESYSESMNSMKSASPYQHSYSPTEYNPYAPAINSQSAYSGYVPRYQQPPYSAYNSFPPYARTKPSHASSIHSIPGNNLPYPLQPSESMGAGGYGTIGQSSGYSNSASLSMFPRENFRNAAPYGQAPTQAQLWGTPRVHHSHVSRITQNEVPSRHTNADNHQLNTELSQESIAQQSLYTEMSLPIQPAADASCSDQSPEVTEFLTTVMQALGKELFKLFLGELTSLRLLVKNKKSMFAQKKSDMIKSILSDQSESEKLVERYNELYSQLTDENVPDFGSNPVLSSFSTSTGPINVMNRNISTTQNIPRSGGVEAAARPSNTGFALPTDYFQSKSRESSNSHYTSSSSQYRPPIRVTGISPSIPSSSSSSQYRYGAVQTSSHRNTTQNRNNDVKVMASYPLYGQSTSYSLDVPIQGLKKSVGPSYYPRLQAAISSSDYRKMHKPNDDVTAGDYRPYMHANETDGFSYDQRRAYNAVKKVSQAESIPPSHTGAQSDAPSTAGGIEESNPNAVTNRGDQDIGDNPNPTLHPGHASGDTETLIVEINTEMSDQAL